MKCAIKLQNRKIFAFFIPAYYIFTNLSREAPQLFEMQSLQQQLATFANNQNKYKTPERYCIHIFVTKNII